MPTEKRYYVNIPKALREQTLDAWMFAFVLGIRTSLPSVTIERAIEVFMKTFNLSEDVYPLDNAKVTYNRCFNNWVEYRKK